MKKNYMTPDMEIVKIQTGQFLLDGSINRGSGTKSAKDSDASYYYDEDDEDEEDW